MNNKYYWYITSNRNRTVLYIGYTENLKQRLDEHKKGKGAVFTKKYNATALIYFEEFETKKEAKSRENNLRIGIKSGNGI